jgi:galactose oxidase-like protein
MYSGLDEVAKFLSPACSGSRWVAGDATALNSPRFEGNSVHLIVEGSVPGQRTEVVYIIGGDTQNLSSCSTGSQVTVEKMVSPGPTATWDPSPADLACSRREACTVILLDGSLLTLAGEGNEGGPAGCVGRLYPELYRPPEIFGAGTPNVWTMMNPHSQVHRYHGVAGTLPNGQAYVGGGNPALGSGHTVEVFSPPFLFAPTAQPQVLSLPSSTPYWSHNQTTFQITVTMWGGGSVDRVALLRPTSMTHAFDSGQRYIQLYRDPNIIVTSVEGLPDRNTVTVRPPYDGNFAPPGWYLLVAVDTNGVPSPGAWIHVS